VGRRTRRTAPRTPATLPAAAPAARRPQAADTQPAMNALRAAVRLGPFLRPLPPPAGTSAAAAAAWSAKTAARPAAAAAVARRPYSSAENGAASGNGEAQAAAPATEEELKKLKEALEAQTAKAKEFEVRAAWRADVARSDRRAGVLIAACGRLAGTGWRRAGGLQDKYLRALAEMENVRIRGRKEVDAAKQFGISKFAKDVRPR